MDVPGDHESVPAGDGRHPSYERVSDLGALKSRHPYSGRRAWGAFGGAVWVVGGTTLFMSIVFLAEAGSAPGAGAYLAVPLAVFLGLALWGLVTMLRTSSRKTE